MKLTLSLLAPCFLFVAPVWGTDPARASALNAEFARRAADGTFIPGMNGVLAIYPEKGYVIVVLANRDPPAAMAIDRFVTEKVIERDAALR